MNTKSELTGLAILVVDDDPLLRVQISTYLQKLGMDVTSAKDAQSARRLLEQLDFDFALVDVNLPDGLGTDLLRDKSIPPNTGVIVITAGGAITGAVEAMRLGAIDYLVKPFDIRQLSLAIARARQVKQADRLSEHRRAKELGGKIPFFFGSSLAALKSQLDKILAADARMQTGLLPVLIQGETGTGKSTIARWLHYHGPRASGPLVELNCSALPENLAESELFGHERGAFTDARAARMGLFEAANGGTLFLDELSSLSSGLQAKLLTAIEDRVIRRLGGNKSIPIDVRLVAASNRDMKTLVNEGLFREDLYHRLDLCRIEIPPLRERGDDIIELAKQVLDHLCARHRMPRKSIHPEGRARLLAYSWPGNVRELAHEIERALVFDDVEELRFAHLPGAEAGSGMSDGGQPVWFSDSYRFPPRFFLEEAIYRTIEHALNLTGQNVSAAARLLGVPRDYVRYRLAKRESEQRSSESAAPASEAFIQGDGGNGEGSSSDSESVKAATVCPS